MFTNNKLSIIVPAFNASKYISRCINSILNQSLKDIEIILVDDNSSDNTFVIMQKYMLQYPNQIKLFKSHKPLDKKGPGAARNLGIHHATGEYIGFVDSDDWVDSNLFSCALSNAETSNAEIVIFGVKDEYTNNSCSKNRYTYTYNSIDNLFALNLLCHLYSNDCYISPMVCQKIYKKDFLTSNNIFFNEDSLYEDDQFTFCCFLNAKKIILIPDVYYHYFQNQHSTTHSFTKEYINSLIDSFKNILIYMKNNGYSDYYKPYFYSYLDKCTSSTIKRLLCCEPQIQIQKNYLIYLFEKIYKEFDIREIISYVDITRFYALFSV